MRLEENPITSVNFDETDVALNRVGSDGVAASVLYLG